MRAELEEACKKRKEAKMARRGALAGDSAFHALWKACKQLREVMQTTARRVPGGVRR